MTAGRPSAHQPSEVAIGRCPRRLGHWAGLAGGSEGFEEGQQGPQQGGDLPGIQPEAVADAVETYPVAIRQQC